MQTNGISLLILANVLVDIVVIFRRSHCALIAFGLPNGGANNKMVSQRLQDMETATLVKREVISDRPIAVTDKITDFGKTALGCLEELKNWAESYQI